MRKELLLYQYKYKMIERINQIIAYLGVTQVRFAEMVGISPASMTHIQKGRNKASLDLVLHILTKFPQISSDWLLFGYGEMLKAKDSTPTNIGSPSLVELREVPKPVDHITIFYKDDTYCNFYPKIDKE